MPAPPSLMSSSSPPFQTIMSSPPSPRDVVLDVPSGLSSPMMTVVALAARQQVGGVAAVQVVIALAALDIELQLELRPARVGG